MGYFADPAGRGVGKAHRRDARALALAPAPKPRAVAAAISAAHSNTGIIGLPNTGHYISSGRVL